MKTINEIMHELAFMSGSNYQVTFAPSVIVLSDTHACRATIKAGRLEVSQTHRTSYRLALNGAFNMLDRQMADAAEEGA